MKTNLRLAFLSLALLTAGLLPAGAQTTATDATVQQVVAAVRQAPADQREQLIKDAITADPDVAPALVAALIAAFPSESPAMTSFVVNSLLSLTIPTESKATILTAVAQSAVNAALSIPTTAVPSLITTVNDVKAALANVGSDFQQAVAVYTTPLTQLPPTVTNTQNNPANNKNETLPTQTIVSDDQP